MNAFVIAGIIGGQEILIILLIILVLFGGRKIPEMMKGIGKGIKEFKLVTKTVEEEINIVKNVKKHL